METRWSSSTAAAFLKMRFWKTSSVYKEVEHEGEGPHVVTGPVAVEGAEPGDWLEVRCLGIEPRVDYGVNSARHSRGSLPDEYPTGGEY
jgi:acetamidase/formamidase